MYDLRLKFSLTSMTVSFSLLNPFRHKAVAKLLIDSGANVNIQEKNGCTAFDVASIIGEPDLPITLASAFSQSAD